MEVKEVLITIFLLSILLLAAIFIGSMIGQLIRNEITILSDIEISIIIAAIILCVELAIVNIASMNPKIKSLDIKDYVKEARQEVY